MAEIYKALFGVGADKSVDLRRGLLPGGHPPTGLPKVRADGVVVALGLSAASASLLSPPAAGAVPGPLDLPYALPPDRRGRLW